MKKFKILVFFTALLIIFQSTVYLFLSFIISFLGKTNSDLIKTVLILAIYPILWIVWLSSKILQDYLKNKCLKLMMLNYKSKITTYIVNHSFQDFEDMKFNEYKSNFMNDAKMIRIRYSIYFVLIENTITILVAAGMLIYISPILFGASFGFSIITLLISIYAGTMLMRWVEKISLNNASYVHKLNNLLKGFQLMFSNSKIKIFQKKLDNFNDEFETNHAKFICKQFKWSIPFGLNNRLSWCICLILNAYLLYSKQITAAEFIAVIPIFTNFNNELIGVFESTANLFSTNSINRKFNLENELNISSGNQFKKVEEVSLQGISISYNEKPIINNLSCDFKANQKYLLSGKSGAGKTTLIKTIVGFKNINQGVILVNNQIIDNKNFYDFKNHISYVEQNTYLFDDTVGFNIALSDHYDIDRINAILKLIQLDSIANFDHSTIIGGDSDKISGGQKQRIGLARALYLNRQIWLIDETTSNLDKENKYIIENIILNQKDKIVVMISHNLSKENQSKINQIITI
ncbi:ATP-binding cassette domain-containing protein [Mesoplasma corruscae]|uniref:ABC transporter permease n=1 Tax=Mesoplasma corruscae TaxID=216874 RepID=A0A2S5RGY3_9MOLU|nr:ABC transporter ATP-binding protein [Mesoplasma corruscae]PPE06560.1 ABC transporter permease [Mesoplasma corruscae]